MRQEWQQLTFLHWPYEPAVVQALLPPGLAVESRRHAAWVGLVPFRITVRGPLGPAIPWLRARPETNVRTYVVGPDGRPGIWFLSLDITAPDAAALARVAWGLPYFWSHLSVTDAGGEVTYRCRRRSSTPAGSMARIRVGAPIPAEALDEFDHYLTARFGLWSRRAGRLIYTRADHPPWPLHRAEVVDIDDTLLQAAGLPTPAGGPVAHFSPGVPVRIGWPRAAPRDRQGSEPG